MVNLKNIFSNKNKLLVPAQLKRLTEHKYSMTSCSLLDPILNPWWCWLVSKTPMWLAPNLITLVGLIVNIATTLILVYYSPNGRTEPPRWACALCALGLFIYQSLDAIDGKQARRTNSSSPLGELFDHGCDSISTIFVALSACLSAQLGFYPKWMFFQCFSAMTLFYCAHWQSYVSGTLRLGKVDVTEAQCMIIMIHLISAVFGPGIWMAKIFGGIELWNSMSVATVVCGVWSLTRIFSVVLAGGVGKNGSTVALFGSTWTNWNMILCVSFLIGFSKSLVSFSHIFITGGSGKNGSTVAGTSVISPVIPLLTVVLSAFIISQKSVDRLFETYPSLYIITFGMVAAKVTNKLVIAHMTKSEMGYTDYGHIGPLLLFLNQYFNNFVPEIYVLCLALVLCTYELLIYCSRVCLEICNHLDIELFRIPYPPKPVQTATALSQKTPFNNANSNAGARHNLNHDQNGAKGGHRFQDDDQVQQPKRQTRSSKRHVVSH
ncbi:cholinephosphotransferase 1 isoform X3 [Contarinia nasturtii]|uniref:cholinephosphotransferase 1 isoform X3 n=1 Tax=Contarinia nasturtii TaxID=265458 RepID=UPI0012D38741|nr:cholinephosphotransferase 1 isoform X3 [Contarinia nasturtii]